jgi:hypothetical protein
VGEQAAATEPEAADDARVFSGGNDGDDRGTRFGGPADQQPAPRVDW